jgi:hypothetical protein
LGVDVERRLGLRWAAAIVALAELPVDDRPVVARLLGQLQRLRAGTLNVAPSEAAQLLSRSLLIRQSEGFLSTKELAAAEWEIPLVIAFLGRVQAIAIGLSRRRGRWSIARASRSPNVVKVSHPAAASVLESRGSQGLCSCAVLRTPHLHCSVCHVAGEVPFLWAVERVNTLTFERQELGIACDGCRAQILSRRSPPPEWLFARKEEGGTSIALFDNLDIVTGEARGVAIIDLSYAHPRLQLCDQPA